MATLTARIEDWLKDEIVAFWKVHGEGPSSALRRMAQEWWALQKFPALAFRDGVSGRRAHLRHGPDVWEVVMVARSYGEDRAGFHAHFSPDLDRAALEQALEYARRFASEVDELIAENERIEGLLERERAR